MRNYRQCNGMTRRQAIRVGALGASGLTLGNYLQLARAGEVRERGRATAAIFVELPGGPSHLDTFDLKPDAPTEIRGEFNPIATNVAGIQISEHLPKLAAQADKFAILRGVTHTLGAHPLGQKFINTGNRPNAALEYPAYGSVVAKELPTPADLPAYVSIPRASQGPGYLGVKYSSLATNEAPRAGRPFNVRGITLGGGMTLKEFERRKGLLQDLDKRFAAIEQQDELLDGLDEFSRKAYRMITSKRTRDAFDISQESDAFRAMFTEDPFSQSCLLAVRLIESGVRFVTLTLPGWDTHQENFVKLKEELLPKLDAGVAGLFAGLSAKGLLDSTAVMVTGEFGRTPKINNRSPGGGRDHYPRCMCMLLGGGPIRGGQVFGASDATAAAPAAEGIAPEDVAATFYHSLGIDHQKEFQSSTGRPLMIVREGKVLSELVS
jgi:hypothetical protein